MKEQEHDAHDEYYSRESIPVLPPIINGRSYFNKAKDRDRAVKEGRATDPLPSNFYKLSRTYERLPKEASVSLRYHWNGSVCAKDSWTWDRDAKSRVLDGAEFNALPLEDRCRACQYEFARA